MSIISSWTCPGLVHITEHTANAHLLRFLKACVLQIEQKNFITTYDSVKAVYSELQIMESLFANPPLNIKETYEAQLLAAQNGNAASSSVPEVGFSVPAPATSAQSIVSSSSAVPREQGATHPQSSIGTNKKTWKSNSSRSFVNSFVPWFSKETLQRHDWRDVAQQSERKAEYCLQGAFAWNNSSEKGSCTLGWELHQARLELIVEFLFSSYFCPLVYRDWNAVLCTASL